MSSATRIAHDGETWISYRDTPWDERVFGFRCAEITELHAATAEGLRALLATFELCMRSRDVKLAYARVDGGSALFKLGLQEAGFYFAEASYKVSHRNLKSTALFDRLIRPGPELVPAEEQHFERLRSILQNDFAHGRLHEDPYVPVGLAGLRYRGWLDDLIAQNREIYAYEFKGDVIGLHVQHRRADTADLVLTGVTRSHALLGLTLWAQVMQLLRAQHVERAESLISAANVPILNLYRHFQFSFDGYLCGYHVRYD